MEQLNIVLHPVNQILYTGMLLVFVAILAKLFMIIADISRIVKRVETLTDVKGWMDLFKFFKKK